VSTPVVCIAAPAENPGARRQKTRVRGGGAHIAEVAACVREGHIQGKK